VIYSFVSILNWSDQDGQGSFSSSRYHFGSRLLGLRPIRKGAGR
jgi:hypothetical protein